MNQDIFSYIKTEEAKFETEEIQVGRNWYWNFMNHVQMIFHLKHGVFFTGENDWLRAFKNIMRPILELAYWTEDLEVKDVNIFIDGDDDKVKSFLIKKYHDEVYVREHDLDCLFDEITENDIDYGGVLVQKGKKRPEVLALNSVAFCDQTDILGGVIGFKFNFSPAKLRSMAKVGWGSKKNGATISIEELIVLATSDKTPIGTQSEKRNDSTTKNIEVYIVRGDMPESYLDEKKKSDKYVNQIQIVAFYTDEKSQKNGVYLYRKEDDGKSIKFFSSNPVFQRALGYGVGESLIHPQIWTNFLTIHKMAMLEAGSKVVLYTDDPNFTQKNKVQDMENLEMTTVETGARIGRIPNDAPTHIGLIENDIDKLYIHAQNSGQANDPLMGVEAKSGTTFKGQERSVAQGRGSHDRRRGKRAKFIEEIYRDWIIPDIIREITSGKKFMATLSTDELRWVSEQMSKNLAGKRTIDLILENKVDVNAEAQATFEALFKKDIIKRGNKRLVEIIEGEFEGVASTIGISIANKQKNLADLSDKVLSIFQFVFQNPQAFMQAMQIPTLAKSFENILEFSNLSIGDFSSLMTPIEQSQPPMTPQPAQEMALNTPQ